MIANICNEIDAMADGESVFRIGEKSYSLDSKAPLKRKVALELITDRVVYTADSWSDLKNAIENMEASGVSLACLMIER